MRLRILLPLAGLVAFVAALVATFPARVAVAWFAPPQVQAWGVEGSLWNGRAEAVAVSGAGIGGLEWSLHPMSLLTLNPAADIRITRRDGFASARVASSLSGETVQVSGLEAAVALGTLPRRLVPDGVAGQLSAQFPDLRLEKGWPTRAAGRIAVADLQLPGVILTLGPLEFVFAGDTDTPAADVRSAGGPLAVEGTLVLPEPGRWSLDVLLAPGENPPRELVEGLAYVGEAAPGGGRRLQLSGEI
ncbi:MAG: type II secretion system protein N [Gammaproteobacteria bacterium]